MFLIGRISAILIFIACVYCSKPSKDHYKDYRGKSYDEYFPDIVVEVPVYETVKKEYSENKIGPKTYKKENTDQVESSTIPTTLSNSRKNFDQTIEKNFDYVEIETPQPEYVTTPYTKVSKSFNVKVPLNAKSNINIVSDLCQDQNKKSLISEKFVAVSDPLKMNDSDILKSNEKVINDSSSQVIKRLSNLNLKYNNTESILDVSDIKEASNIPEESTVKSVFKRIEKKTGKNDNFSGFGHTAKILETFLNMNRLFTDILEPVGKKLATEAKAEEYHTNINELVTKKASLKMDTFSSTRASNKKSNYKVKIEKPNKRSNLHNENNLQKKFLSNKMTTPNNINTDNILSQNNEQQKQLAQGVKNFKLTMNMLANIDKYVSSILKTYLDNLSSYIEDNKSF